MFLTCLPCGSVMKVCTALGKVLYGAEGEKLPGLSDKSF